MGAALGRRGQQSYPLGLGSDARGDRAHFVGAELVELSQDDAAPLGASLRDELTSNAVGDPCASLA